MHCISFSMFREFQEQFNYLLIELLVLFLRSLSTVPFSFYRCDRDRGIKIVQTRHAACERFCRKKEIIGGSWHNDQFRLYKARFVQTVQKWYYVARIIQLWQNTTEPDCIIKTFYSRTHFQSQK